MTQCDVTVFIYNGVFIYSCVVLCKCIISAQCLLPVSAVHSHRETISSIGATVGLNQQRVLYNYGRSTETQ